MAQLSNKVIITCAVTGSIHTPTMSEALPITPDQIAAIEDLANHEILANAPVRHFETSRSHAEELGAIAFFGEKYGDVVRVLEAGPHSTELCGGTHVANTAEVGIFTIVSEGSSAANVRRIEAIANRPADQAP